MMKLEEALKEYRFDNVGQARAIAAELGYKEEYNKGSLRFTRHDDEYRTSIAEIRSAIPMDNEELQDRSRESVSLFFDKEKATGDFTGYKVDLRDQHNISIVKWEDLKRNSASWSKDSKSPNGFTIIDHNSKVCYTGKSLYDQALQNGYTLDGRGTQLAEGETSELTQVNGQAAKMRRNSKDTSVFYRKETLIIPDRVLGKRLSQKQKDLLLEGKTVPLSVKGSNILLQVDRDLNRVMLLSDHEIKIPPIIGNTKLYPGYKLTEADTFLLANGYAIESKLLHSDQGYILADVGLSPDKKGVYMANIQRISDGKAQEIMKEMEISGKKNQTIDQIPVVEPKVKVNTENQITITNISQEQAKVQDSAVDMEKELKDAIANNNFERISRLANEGYKPSEQVISGLGKDGNLSEDQAIVVEKLFGIKPDIQHIEEIKEEKIQEGEKTITVELSPEQTKKFDTELKEAVLSNDFSRLTDLKEQGYRPTALMLQTLEKEGATQNQLTVVNKIFDLKPTAKVVNDVRLAQGQSSNPDRSRPIANTINQAFSNL